jgi:hypothetical protein
MSTAYRDTQDLQDPEDLQIYKNYKKLRRPSPDDGRSLFFLFDTRTQDLQDTQESTG